MRLQNPLLENDKYYIEWNKKVDRQSKLDVWFLLINPAFDPATIFPGINQELFDLQEVLISTVLQLILQTPHGMNLVGSHLDHPRILWNKHESHLTSSDVSQQVAILISDRLTNMKICNSKSKTIFLE